MKQSITLLALLLIAFTSCRKVNTVTEVPADNPAIGIRFSISPSSWTTENNGISYTASLNVPELTQDIYDHGAVLTYISFGTDFYEALPEVFDGIAYGAIHSPGFVSIDYHALDGSELDAPSIDTDIKIVLIPASVAKAHPEVDLKNLKDVEKVFLKNQSF